MSLYPNTKPGKIGFFNSKIAPWTTNSVAIGTTSAAVTALDGLVTAAQTKLDEQIAAEQAVKTATQAANNAVKAMVDAGADIIKAIRAKAATTAGVYELAQLPDPATPTPVNTLGLPHDFKVTLGQDGALTTTFKCANPRATGTIYQVFRALNDETVFTYLGGTGRKSFVDATVPAGTAKVMYKVQAVRSTAQGPAAVLTVLIGVGAGGQMAASVAVQPKLAA
jgi:hypothetical protein